MGFTASLKGLCEAENVINERKGRRRRRGPRDVSIRRRRGEGEKKKRPRAFSLSVSVRTPWGTSEGCQF